MVIIIIDLKILANLFTALKLSRSKTYFCIFSRHKHKHNDFFVLFL